MHVLSVSGFPQCQQPVCRPLCAVRAPLAGRVHSAWIFLLIPADPVLTGSSPLDGRRKSRICCGGKPQGGAAAVAPRTFAPGPKGRVTPTQRIVPLMEQAVIGVIMPIYEYQCPKCQRVFEEWVKASDAHGQEPCPDCGTPSPRIISQTSFVLKGGGWYVSDYGYSKGISEDGGAPAGSASDASAGRGQARRGGQNRQGRGCARNRGKERPGGKNRR